MHRKYSKVIKDKYDLHWLKTKLRNLAMISSIKSKEVQFFFASNSIKATYESLQFQNKNKTVL